MPGAGAPLAPPTNGPRAGRLHFQRVEDNASTVARKSGFNVVTKIAEYSSTILRFCVTEDRPGAIRDSKFGIASRLPVHVTLFTLHNSNPLNEILYSFSCKSAPLSNLGTLPFKRFGTNNGADTQAASDRAARKI